MSLEIVDAAGSVLHTVTPSESPFSLSLRQGETYSIVPYDSYSSGWNGGGSAEVRYGDSTEASITSVSGSGGASQSVSFTVAIGCVSCEAGTYADAAAASACSLCPAGTFQNETEASSCTACSSIAPTGSQKRKIERRCEAGGCVRSI